MRINIFTSQSEISEATITWMCCGAHMRHLPEANVCALIVNRYETTIAVQAGTEVSDRLRNQISLENFLFWDPLDLDKLRPVTEINLRRCFWWGSVSLAIRGPPLEAPGFILLNWQNRFEPWTSRPRNLLCNSISIPLPNPPCSAFDSRGHTVSSLPTNHCLVRNWA